MTQQPTIRIVVDPPLDGPTNMARDEAIMILVGTGDAPPTLRLYQWEPPTISLGYFQCYADYESLPPPEGDLAVVRRLTGGGAILHDLELTYALALPTGHSLLARGPKHLYELAHNAITAALGDFGIEASPCGTTDDSGAARGPFFCFARRHAVDLVIGTEKLVGSAQRRTQHAILQHGSIILGRRFDEQPSAGSQLDHHSLIQGLPPKLIACFAKESGCVCQIATLSEEELSLAASLTVKYAGEEWTRKS